MARGRTLRIHLKTCDSIEKSSKIVTEKQQTFKYKWFTRNSTANSGFRHFWINVSTFTGGNAEFICSEVLRCCPIFEIYLICIYESIFSTFPNAIPVSALPFQWNLSPPCPPLSVEIAPGSKNAICQVVSIPLGTQCLVVGTKHYAWII